MSFLQFRDVSLAFECDKPIVSRFDLHMDQGQFVTFIGRSGSGKTTLLKLAAGLLKPDSGKILINGSEVCGPRDNVGVVFQSPTLLEWLRVRDNVLLPVSLKRKLTQDDKTKADQLLELVGLSAHADHYPLELSGGQQSRVAIVRALMREPSLLLLDEPFAALDALTREALQDDLMRLCAESGVTVLFITHDITEAVYLSDRVVVIRDGGITLDVPVNLPQDRGLSVRYSLEFNEICLSARSAMEGARL